MSSELKSFTLFPNLPAELRVKIWKHAAPGARIVPITYKEVTLTYSPRIAPPAVLQANYEARTEALKIYHQLRLGPYINYGCYVDLSKDTVYIKSDFGFDPEKYCDFADEIGAENIEIPEGWTQRLKHYPKDCNMHKCVSSDPYFCNEAQVIIEDLLHSPDFDHILPRLAIEARTWYKAILYFQRACFDSRMFQGTFLIFEKPNQSLEGEISFWKMTEDDIQGMSDDEEGALDIARAVARAKPEIKKWGSACIWIRCLGIGDRPTKMLLKRPSKEAQTKPLEQTRMECKPREPSMGELVQHELKIASARPRSLEIWSIWMMILLCILLSLLRGSSSIDFE